ncbi:non-homologous end-joining DNA ligase [Streptomyces sp. NPDC090127]|uniref:non-homologous end-joining DNA ligase n=1 Tax=Streptomyces sp. NPDC090127 TaxID=3365953 RepID=UPI003830D4D1
MMSGAQKVRAGRRTVEVGKPEKVLFPDPGITKADLAAYYRTVAPRMLPHLRGRPLMLERHPDGVDGSGFMQKDIPASFPDWVHRAELPKEGGTVTYVVGEDTATLVLLADQGCVTLHRWLSRADRPDHPDRMVFDLDPADDDGSGDGFAHARDAARLLHELLDDLGLPALLMTTGSRGLHVVVPLDRSAPFDDVRAFAADVATVLADRHPDRLTTAVRKQARAGRLYLDIQRNAYGQTAVAPYSVRALPDAPVAAPLAWADLDDPELDARRWHLTDADRLLTENPWSPAPRPHSLGPAADRLRRAATRT